MILVRSYGQYCSIARGLDVVGDRWTLLIVRELLIQGPCRFTDLKNGLPGIAANLLSTRLRELEQAGLMARDEAPPPIATTLYRLTEAGRALEPALKAIGFWGLRYMGTVDPQDAFRPQWLAYLPGWFTVDAAPKAPPAGVQLVVGDAHAVLEIGDGRVDTRVGRADAPDLVLDGPANAVLGLLMGVIDLDLATQIGLTANGRREVLTRIRPIAQPVLPDSRTPD